MRVLTLTDARSHEIASKEAALTLFKDGAVVYPTDTIYGLGVNALDGFAVERLFKIKKRPPERAIPLMVSSLTMARALAFIDKKQEAILQELWPGPFTFVLWKKKIVHPQLTGGRETVALRIPAHPFCQSMLRDFEGPITTTSANISDELPARSAGEIAARFEKEEIKPDLIIDVGTLPETYPSTVIDLTHEPPKILRINPTTKDQLLKILKVIE